MFKKRELVLISRDRVAILLLIAFLATVILQLVITALNTHVSDVQLPVRYTSYGLTNIYRDRWYSLLSFLLFGLLVGGVNGYLIVKLYSVRRGLALGFAAMSLFVSIIALVITLAVFRLAALSL